MKRRQTDEPSSCLERAKRTCLRALRLSVPPLVAPSCAWSEAGHARYTSDFCWRIVFLTLLQYCPCADIQQQLPLLPVSPEDAAILAPVDSRFVATDDKTPDEVRSFLYRSMQDPSQLNELETHVFTRAEIGLRSTRMWQEWLRPDQICNRFWTQQLFEKSPTSYIGLLQPCHLYQMAHTLLMPEEYEWWQRLPATPDNFALATRQYFPYHDTYTEWLENYRWMWWYGVLCAIVTGNLRRRAEWELQQRPPPPPSKREELLKVLPAVLVDVVMGYDGVARILELHVRSRAFRREFSFVSTLRPCSIQPDQLTFCILNRHDVTLTWTVDVEGRVVQRLAPPSELGQQRLAVKQVTWDPDGTLVHRIGHEPTKKLLAASRLDELEFVKREQPDGPLLTCARVELGPAESREVWVDHDTGCVALPPSNMCSEWTLYNLF